MNPEQIRARMKEILAAIEAMGSSENFTDDQVTQVGEYSTEFKGLKAKLDTAEQIEAMKADAAKSAGRQIVASNPAPNAPAPVRTDAKARRGGFETSGQWLSAVRDAGQGRGVHENLKNAATAYEKSGEDGGFLVPEEMSQEIVKKLDVAEALLPRTRQLQVSGNSLTLPIDENQPWTQGVIGYWTAEGAQIQSSKNALGQASWRLHKVAALVLCTDELLDDAVAMESYIQSAAPAALTQKINEAIISGNGVGKPKGILNSPFRVVVPAEGSQSADTIVARNIINMYARMLPASRANAVWYVNAQCEPQLWAMKDDLGNFIYLSPGGQMNTSPYGLLMGRPVVPMLSALPQLGDEGDVVFADLSYYYTIVKAGGVKSAQSIHMNFDKELTAFRFSLRIDGSCPFKAPVTTQYGNYQMSGIVTLAAR